MLLLAMASFQAKDSCQWNQLAVVKRDVGTEIRVQTLEGNQQLIVHRSFTDWDDILRVEILQYFIFRSSSMGQLEKSIEQPFNPTHSRSKDIECREMRGELTSNFPPMAMGKQTTWSTRTWHIRAYWIHILVRVGKIAQGSVEFQAEPRV